MRSSATSCLNSTWNIATVDRPLSGRRVVHFGKAETCCANAISMAVDRQDLIGRCAAGNRDVLMSVGKTGGRKAFASCCRQLQAPRSGSAA
jgi:hypothetical protein